MSLGVNGVDADRELERLKQRFKARKKVYGSRMLAVPEDKGMSPRTTTEDGRQYAVSDGCGQTAKDIKREPKDVLKEVSKTHHEIHALDKIISNLEMELAAAKAAQESIVNGSPASYIYEVGESSKKIKYLMVVGINTAFSSRKRSDSVGETWMPQGDKRKKLEEEKGIIMRLVIGHRSKVPQSIHFSVSNLLGFADIQT